MLLYYYIYIITYILLIITYILLHIIITYIYVCIVYIIYYCIYIIVYIYILYIYIYIVYIYIVYIMYVCIYIYTYYFEDIYLFKPAAALQHSRRGRPFLRRWANILTLGPPWRYPLPSSCRHGWPWRRISQYRNLWWRLGIQFFTKPPFINCHQTTIKLP